MHFLDPETMRMPDGSSVADRLRAFTAALEAHGHKGIFLVFDPVNNRHYIGGHIPENNEELRKILQNLADRLNAGMASMEGLKSIPFPQTH